MSRQAIVGIFTLAGLVGLFIVYFILADVWTRTSGFRIGVHFISAAGLTRGSAVYESGIQIGTVDEIRMLDDFTVSVIVSVKNNVDIPRASRFVIEAPLTGSSTLRIIPPKAPKATLALLPREVLPVDQQPVGSTPVSVADLLAQGQGQLKRLDRILDGLAKREPALLDSLQSALNNANALATNANGAMQQFSAHANAIADQLQDTLKVASTNVIDLTQQLNDTLKSDRGSVDRLLASMNATAGSLQAASLQLQNFAQTPELKENLLTTTREIARTTQNMADLTGDLRKMTGDPATQAQLKNTVSNIDAATQRVNSLLGQLGGTSSVYGVDSHATAPPPPPAGGMIVPPSAPPYVPPPSGGTSGTKQTSSTGDVPMASLHSKFEQLAKSLFVVQIRLSELSKQASNAPNNPLLNAQQGPQADFNMVLAPQSKTNVLAGVNDLSVNQTWNLAVQKQPAPGFLIGGGILYSRPGVLGSVGNNVFGLDTRIYGLPYTYVDAYLHIRPFPQLEIFGGERDLAHPSHRTTYGLQYLYSP